MARRGSLARRGFAALFSEAAWQAFWTWIFPPLAGVAAVAAGIVERFPFMWVIMAGAVSFGGMSLGVLAFSRWLFLQSAKDKIVFQRCTVTRDTETIEQTIVLGIVLKNTAHFPIEVNLSKMATSCASRIPEGNMRLPRSLRVDAYNDFFFHGDLIDITGVVADPLNAILDVEFLYGRPGGKEYRLSYIHKLIIPIDRTKPFHFSAIRDAKEQIGQSP